MSKVKFIQWGTPESPKTYNDYTTSFASVKEQYPGGVIFVTYTDDKNKQKQEIWANGVQYSVGGGGGNVIYGTVIPDASGVVKTSDGEVITGDEGSIYVYTTPEYQTAYYWDLTGNKWLPFNVDAENVWFHDDMTMAGSYDRIGNFTKSTTGTSTVCTQLGISTTTYNLKTLLENIFSKEERDSSSWSYTFSSVLSGKPFITFSKNSGEFSYSDNNSIAIVGTQINISTTTPSSSASQQACVTPKFGYNLGSGTTKVTGTKTVSGTPTASGSDSVSLTANKTGVLSGSILTVAAGSQTVTATASGKTYTLDTTVTDPVVVPLTNLEKPQTALVLDTENWGQSSTSTTAVAQTHTKSVTGVYPVYFEGANKWPSIHSDNVKNSSTKFVKTKSNTEVAVLEVPTEKAGTLQVYAAGQWTNHTSYTTSTVSKTINGLTVNYTQYKPNAADGDGTEYRLV